MPGPKSLPLYSCFTAGKSKTLDLFDIVINKILTTEIQRATQLRKYQTVYKKKKHLWPNHNQ